MFVGGHVEGLGKAPIATSPTFRWADGLTVSETIEARYDKFVAIAERSVVIGYEQAIATAWLT